MHLEHLLSFPHCVSPMRIMVNNHSYFPIFGHCGWNVPRQVVLCSFCFVFGIFVVCFFLFYLFVWFFLSFFYWMGVWIMEWWSFTILQSLLVSSTYCFEQTLQNAFGTSYEAITGQLDVLSRSHYSVFYVSWSFKMQLFENIWKDLQFFC